MKCPSCGHDNLPGADECEHCQASLTREDVPGAETGVERSLMEDPVACLHPVRPLTVGLDSSLAEAIGLMRNHGIGCLLVTAQAGVLAGILTERDLLYKVSLEVSDLSRYPVSDFMTTAPESCKADYPLGCALQRMIVSDLRYLPLVDTGGRPTGIVSSRDIIAYMATRFQGVGYT